MSYATVRAALHGVFEDVAGLAVVLPNEPRSVADAPLLYSLLDSFEVLHDQGIGSGPGYRYRILHRMVFRYQDNEACETELMGFVNAIPEALDAERGLGGVLNGGIAFITEGDAGWIDINGITYRSLDFFSDVLEQPS